MVTIAHKDLTGADLHEPKGIATAASGSVYKADGLGSGVWTPLVLPTGLFQVTSTTFFSSGTWTKPANLFMVKVYCIGGGGEGGCVVGGAALHNGGTSSFGGHCSATGGTGTSSSTSTAPPGGNGSGGIINLPGVSGVYSGAASVANAFYPGGGTIFPNYGLGGWMYGDGSVQIGTGGGGGTVIGFYNTGILNATESVTVGLGGTGNSGSIPSAVSGAQGIVHIEEYILT